MNATIDTQRLADITKSFRDGEELSLDEIFELRDALPTLLAVFEAAQRAVPYMDAYREGTGSLYHNAYHNLQRALRGESPDADR